MRGNGCPAVDGIDVITHREAAFERTDGRATAGGIALQHNPGNTKHERG